MMMDVHWRLRSRVRVVGWQPASTQDATPGERVRYPLFVIEAVDAGPVAEDVQRAIDALDRIAGARSVR